MRVLHIGCGYRPWRVNGLIEYAEDLMDIQVTQGFKVGYFFTGRYYPFLRKPWLRKWVKRNISMYEVINSLVFRESAQVTKYPGADINEEYSEKFFLRVLSEFKPDVIHIHELFGLPSSLVDIVKLKSLPVLMTLHDYFILCPTSKLFDYNNSRCLKPDVGDSCKICYSQDIRFFKHFIGSTLDYERRHSLLPIKVWVMIYHKLIFLSYKLKLHNLKLFLREEKKQNDVGHSFRTADYLGEKFQQRRDINVERLNKIDLLVAQSFRTAEIYRTLGVQDNKITTVHSSVRHIKHIKPKSMKSVFYPINIATMNGLASSAKGAYLILETLHQLKEAGLTSQVKFFVMGYVLDTIKDELLQFDNVVYKGLYNVADLNKLLEEIHVGIVPSVWEEVYGYVGIEFLAKGIPVIGNKLGGIADYTVDNVTGWLNKSNTADGLAQIITDIIRNPAQILHLNQSILANYCHIIKSMDTHFEEMDKIYRELIQSNKKQELAQIEL